MDEMKLVYSMDEFDIVMHDDGLVEISAGDKHHLQLTREAFDDMIHQRSIFMGPR